MPSARQILPKAWILPLVFFLALSPIALGALVNVTVDDETGDPNTGEAPTYAPLNGWAQGTTCTGCLVKPDPSLAFGGTWHDSTVGALNSTSYTITYSFSGTAVYAFFIMANQVEFATTFTNMSFTLDGSLSGEFSHTPDSTTDYAYNVSGFSKTGLSNGQHTLVISNDSGTNSSLVLFDYLIYTSGSEDDSTTSTSTQTSSTSTAQSSASASATPSGGTSSSQQSAQPVLGTTPTGSSGGNSASTSSNESSSSLSSPSTLTKKNVGAIVGGIAAASIVAILVGVIFACWRNPRLRARVGRDKFRSMIQPYDAASAFRPTANDRDVRWDPNPRFLSSSPPPPPPQHRRFSTAPNTQGDSPVTPTMHDDTANEDVQSRRSLLALPSRPPTYATTQPTPVLASRWSDDTLGTAASAFAHAARSRAGVVVPPLPSMPRVYAKEVSRPSPGTTTTGAFDTSRAGAYSEIDASMPASRAMVRAVANEHSVHNVPVYLQSYQNDAMPRYYI